MKRFIIYARKSSEAEDRQVLSIDSQITELKGLAKKLNIHIIEIFTESKSAKAPGRPIFSKMMGKTIEGKVDGILCWKLDRLARNPVDGGSIIWAIKQCGIQIITPSQTYDQANENSFMMYVEFGMAQKFIDDLSKNVKRGLQTKAQKGWLPSGAKPGYTNDKFADKGSKTVVTDTERFPLIRKAWDLMLTRNYTPPQILRILNKDWGYRTPKHRKIGGNPMSRSMIYKVFTDPFYYGQFEYPVGSGNWYTGKHEPMITKQEFDRAQILLGRKGQPRPQIHFDTFPFKSMKCGECGACVTADEKWQTICSYCKFKFASKNNKSCPRCNTAIEEMKRPTLLHYKYYHCTKRKNPDCSQGCLRDDKAEKQIGEVLSNIQISERFKNWAIKHLNEINEQEVDDRNTILTSLDEAYKDVITRIDNLVKLKISPQNSDGSLLSDNEFKEQKDRLLKEKEEIEEKRNDLGDRIKKWVQLSEEAFNFAHYAKFWFENGDPKRKREIFQGLGSNLKLFEKIVRINLELPLEKIKETKEKEVSISPMFEPEKEGYTTEQLEAYWSQNPSLLPRQNLNKTDAYLKELVLGQPERLSTFFAYGSLG